jgi:CelD/BcsL family acetyltransferase involved in cellulose biosynthesis
MNKKISITEITSLTPEFKKEWEELSKKSAMSHYFNSLDWFLTCLDAFSYENFLILTARCDGELVGLLPLIKGRNYGISFFKNPGEKFIDRSPLLMQTFDKRILNKILNSLKKKGSFYLTELIDETILLLKPKHYLIKKIDTNFYLPLGEGSSKHMSSRSKKNMDKLIERNKEHLEFKQYNSDVNALKIVRKVAKRSHKSRKNIESFDEENDRIFFEKLIENNPQSAKLNILFYKKRPISFEIGLLFENIYYGINTSFDYSFRQLSPGKMIEYFLIDSLKSAHVKVFDFSRGDDNVKRALTSLFKYQYDVYYLDSKFKNKIITSSISIEKTIKSNPKLYQTYRNVKFLQNNFQIYMNILIILRFFLNIISFKKII